MYKIFSDLTGDAAIFRGAGITLAGANLALDGKARNSILQALEAQDLDLRSTPLVVDSDCQAVQGRGVGVCRELSTNQSQRPS